MARPRRWASCLKCRGRLNRFGFDRNGQRRARCPQCRTTFTTTSDPLQRIVRGKGKYERARIFLLKGESIRGTAQIVGISKGTVQRVSDELRDIPIKCGCGSRAGHRGWCSVRVARSPARQAFLSRWGRGKELPEAATRASNVPSFCIGTPSAFTTMAIERTCLRYGVLGDHGMGLDDYFKASNEIWKAAHALGCRVCGTFRKYGGQRCRRCTRIQSRIREIEISVGSSISYPIWRRNKDFQLFAKNLANDRSLSRYQKLTALLQWKPESYYS